MSASTALRHASKISTDLIRQAHDWADTTPPDVVEEPVEPWTLDRIQSAARVGASRMSVSGGGALDGAWAGAALHVAAYPDAPWWDVVNAAHQGILDEYNDLARYRGARAPLRRALYWLDWTRHSGDPAAGDDHRAVRQVFVALPPKHQETLLAAASTRTVAEAGTLLGITPSGFSYRLRLARQAALDLWWSPDPAPTVGRKPRPHGARTATHCPQGHEWATNEARNGARSRKCRQCARDSTTAWVARKKTEAAA